ncbi:hypothetical protein O9G_004083 [Rozella allomycis CSF55]|uniref:RNI-like protein n=1 Tax=Rozella allomycis (strain CSF55) TaxID=988480 RepID=A0A075AXN7_ROZAC|nr:hypothetical protein O9G_004083 [Rozella allomycis CSF55]|eukprot:EPZ35065.1 hypothetical protein O9G_004083 [Rozella allomycis CSF55]
MFKVRGMNHLNSYLLSPFANDLMTLNLSNNEIGSEGLSFIKMGIERCQNIKNLNLSNTDNPFVFDQLSLWLQQSQSFSVIDISKNKLKKPNVEVINNFALSKLDFSNTKITKQHGAFLASEIAKNVNMKLSLNISNNDLGKGIVDLDVSNNNISNYLSELLPGQELSINLRGLNLSRIGFSDLINFLRRVRITLEDLSLAGLGLKFNEFSILISELQRFPCLKTLVLDENKFNDKCVFALYRLHYVNSGLCYSFKDCQLPAALTPTMRMIGSDICDNNLLKDLKLLKSSAQNAFDKIKSELLDGESKALHKAREFTLKLKSLNRTEIKKLDESIKNHAFERVSEMFENATFTNPIIEARHHDHHYGHSLIVPNNLEKVCENEDRGNMKVLTFRESENELLPPPSNPSNVLPALTKSRPQIKGKRLPSRTTICSTQNDFDKLNSSIQDTQSRESPVPSNRNSTGASIPPPIIENVVDVKNNQTSKDSEKDLMIDPGQEIEGNIKGSNKASPPKLPIKPTHKINMSDSVSSHSSSPLIPSPVTSDKPANPKPIIGIGISVLPNSDKPLLRTNSQSQGTAILKDALSWIQKYSDPQIENLEDGIKDGISLIKALEVITIF